MDVLPILAWEIWYADGSVASSDEATWEAAPAKGVLAVIWWHVLPYRTHTWGIEPFKLPGSAHVKWGREIPDDEWESFRKMIQALPHRLLAA